MLKSTHRSSNVPTPATAPLPPGWTEHKAPTGHSYYYNAETKQSTYTRPVNAPAEEELQIDYGATKGDVEVQASINALEEFRKHNDSSFPSPGHFTGGRAYQDRSRQGRQGDRPKSKTPIPNCAPWLLVKTKLGRRFVHNTETRESFWKFPSDVMMAVIDMDRMEWEEKKRAEERKVQESKKEEESQAQRRDEGEKEDDNGQRLPHDQYDSDSYEEVEVTDDEAEGVPDSKRPRLDQDQLLADMDRPPFGPQEFNEDDIAWQLAAMHADADDPGYNYPDEFLDEDADEDGGMEFTEADSQALFRSLLDDHQISPFSTFDALIDTNTAAANALISDSRWLALPNMSSRRSAFDSWSRDRVTERNANAETGEESQGNGVDSAKSGKVDPKVAYLRFLSDNATPKLYWPEFKRKWRKAPEMTNRHFADKDREKLYREYISKLTKTSDSDRRKELIALLKTTSEADWSGGDIPSTVEKDLRFYVIRDGKSRQELVEGFVSTLSR